MLLFISLSDRRGCPFDPKVFCEKTKRKWNCIEDCLKVGVEDSVILHGDDDMECPISREDVKFVLIEKDNPAEYARQRSFIQDSLKEDLSRMPHLTLSM